MRESTFTGNTSTSDGGTIFNAAFATLDLSGSTFAGNSTGNGGGGLMNEQHARRR